MNIVYISVYRTVLGDKEFEANMWILMKVQDKRHEGGKKTIANGIIIGM